MNRANHIKALAAWAFIGLCLPGCDMDAENAKIDAEGKPHRVILYSGGKAVREWTTNAKVRSEDRSDGWFFRDAKSGQLVRVSGNVVVEVIVNPESRP